MMKYHVTILQPNVAQYYPLLAFQDAAGPCVAALRDLGHEATLGVNTVRDDATNILLNYQSLKAPIPERYIIWQWEAILDGEGTPRPGLIKPDVWYEAEAVWDYAPENIAYTNDKLGYESKLIGIGYHDSISPSLGRNVSGRGKDIDVLFYGHLSPRRRQLLGEMRTAGLIVKHLPAAGRFERDCWIHRSKVVLNVHWRDGQQPFEQLRVGAALNRGACVVSESAWEPWEICATSSDSAWMQSGFEPNRMPDFLYDFQTAVADVVAVVGNREAREAYAAETNAAFKRCKMVDLLREVI